MCEVCAVTAHFWTCVKYVPKQVRTCVKYARKSILGISASAGNSASRLLGFSASPGNSASRLLGFAREFGFSASRLRPGIRLLGFSASRLPPPFRGPALPPPCHCYVHDEIVNIKNCTQQAANLKTKLPLKGGSKIFKFSFWK